MPLKPLFVNLACLALTALLPAAPAELKVLGNQLVTKVGNCPVRLKGVDVPGLEWSNSGDGPSAAPNKALAVAQEAVLNWGANFIRLPLNQDRWLGTGCASSAPAYQALVQGVVDWCSANGVYVLLDLHWSDLGTANANQVCTAGQHDMPDDNSTLFWQDVAGNSKFANNPAVLFDLYNEPGGGKNGSALSADAAGWALWRDGGTVPASSDGVAYHTPGMQGLLSAIRAAGANNLVFAGGRDWAFDLRGIVDYSAALTDTASGNGVAYPTHIYPFKWGGNGCVVDACFDGAVPSYVRDAYPVIVTEFGPEPGDPEGFIPGVLAWIEKHKLSYTAWCMHPGASPCLISDWNFTKTDYFGAQLWNQLESTNPLGCNPATATVSPTISPTRTVTVTMTPLPSCGEAVVARVNASGPAYADGSGGAWVADAFYTGGSASSTTLSASGTADPTLFKTARWGNPVRYDIPLPNGSYRVEILESENYWSAVGKRVFSVSLEGSVLLANHDIYAATGGKYVAEILSYNVTVSDGSLTLRLDASADNAQLCGLRVTHLGPACPASPTPSPSFTVSPTFTVSPSISPTWSPSPVVSPTPSATVSPTWTVSPTATVTATPAPAGGPLEIKRASCMPNPNARWFYLELSRPAERVELELYSPAYQKVAALRHDALPAGWSRLDLATLWLGLPNGLYFTRVRAWDAGEEAKGPPLKMVLVR